MTQPDWVDMDLTQWGFNVDYNIENFYEYRMKNMWKMYQENHV